MHLFIYFWKTLKDDVPSDNFSNDCDEKQQISSVDEG